MSISDEIEIEMKYEEKRRKKWGAYENPEGGCPNCGRHRVMIGSDGKHRCEKCAWCIEDCEYDGDMFT